MPVAMGQLAGSTDGSAMDDKDRQLIAHLKANAREPVATLARRLELGRSTVQARIEKLERAGVIKGYTVTLGEGFKNGRMSAYVMLTLNPKLADRATHEIRKMPEVQRLDAVTGTYDLIARIETGSPGRMDETLDEIGRIAGVEKTRSTMILSNKVQR